MPNKNYIALYLNYMGMQFSSALVLSFVGAHLYLQGLSLPLIFLYFGLEFLLRGMFSPISSILAQKYGFKTAILIANVLLITYFVSLSFYATYPSLVFCGLAFHSLSRGIYYPIKHHMEAFFIRDNTRGRFLTLETVISGLTAAIAVGFATYSITVWHSFLPSAILASVFLGVASFSVVKLLGDMRHEHAGGYRAVLGHVTSHDFRSDLVAYSGIAANIGFNNVVVALLVFFVVNSLKLFGLIMVSVFLLEMILTLAYGSFIDQNRLKSNKLASFLQISSYLTFLMALSPLLVAAVKTTYDFVWNIFDSSFTARFDTKIKKHGLVYACSKEVVLGMGAACYCLLLSLVAYLWHGGVFPVSLILASAGVLVAWQRFKD